MSKPPASWGLVMERGLVLIVLGIFSHPLLVFCCCWCTPLLPCQAWPEETVYFLGEELGQGRGGVESGLGEGAGM